MLMNQYAVVAWLAFGQVRPNAIVLHERTSVAAFKAHRSSMSIPKTLAIWSLRTLGRCGSGAGK
jgi:hypothetical protein